MGNPKISITPTLYFNSKKIPEEYNLKKIINILEMRNNDIDYSN